MALTVAQIAFHHTEDIDPSKRVEAPELVALANIAAERAKDALKTLPAYDELQRFVISELIASMQVTHRTITTILRECKEQPESVDTLTLARTQLEGLYAFCLMLQGAEYVNLYLKDGWKKQYVAFLLQREETKHLPRFQEFSDILGPQHLEEGRVASGVTEAERWTVDLEQLGTPLPTGLSPEPIREFPTPGRVVKKITTAARRRMLERLLPEYAELSSFTHGLPHSNMLRGLLNPRSLHRKYFTADQAEETAQRDVTERAFVVSLMSIIQASTEVIELCPLNLELRAGATNAWKAFSQDWLLGKSIWEIRTKSLLGIL